MSEAATPFLLPDQPLVSADVAAAVRVDYERFAADGLPRPLEPHLLERYRLDVATHYAGFPIPNPWGKASGQLSMTARQVQEDVEAGLGLVVLKTVIAQDAAGTQTMQAWAIKEARMVAEPIVGKSGRQGWTISWKGRGWWQSFEEYLQLIRDAGRLAAAGPTLIVPSCKFHLPTIEESAWKVSEYEYTLQHMLAAWHAVHDGPMPLEKDFSPTLAGSERARAESQILRWLRTVPRLVRAAAPAPVRVGLKLFNALFDDEFQLAMLRAIHAAGGDRPDFFVYANRLFDPEREFDGHRGIAYGGPDLSERNLRVMTAFQRESTGGNPPGRAAADDSLLQPLPWSATGDIGTGKMALEYALRGASSFQLHTFFQLPATEYRMQGGSRTEKALHELYFHPQTGFVVWMHHLARVLGLTGDPLRFRDVIGRGHALRTARVGAS